MTILVIENNSISEVIVGTELTREVVADWLNETLMDCEITVELNEHGMLMYKVIDLVSDDVFLFISSTDKRDTEEK